MYFRSRRGWLLGLILWGALVAPFFFLKDLNLSGANPGLLILILILLVTAFLWFGTGYLVGNGQIVIRIGPFSMGKIAISQIRQVSRSYNPLSSPACSLKRLRVDYGKNGLALLSPRHETEFIDALRKENKDIRVEIPQESRHWITYL